MPSQPAAAATPALGLVMTALERGRTIRDALEREVARRAGVRGPSLRVDEMDDAEAIERARFELREAEKRRDRAEIGSSEYRVAVRQVGQRWGRLRQLLQRAGLSG